MSHSSSSTSTRRFDLIIKAYDTMVQSKMNADWPACLVTFMFAQLRGSVLSQSSQMKGEIERIYSIFLTHVVRYPNSKRDKPILIGMADLPVPKRRKKLSILGVYYE